MTKHNSESGQTDFERHLAKMRADSAATKAALDALEDDVAKPIPYSVFDDPEVVKYNERVREAAAATETSPLLQPVDADQVTASMLMQDGAAVTDAQKAKTQRIARLLELPPGSPVPSDGRRKRGRPITRTGALRRELGFSRLGGWKATRLAEIPKDQFEALLDESHKRLKETGRALGEHGMLRLAGKLAPEKPRPHVRGAANAIMRLTRAKLRLEELYRKLREVASDEELQLLSDARQQVDLALEALVGSSAQAVACLKQIEPTEIQGFLDAKAE